MIRLNDCSISLDKREPGSDIDFISHAHTDHIAAARRSREALMSAETRELIGRAYGTEMEARSSTAFRLLDAGHMLGSKQLYIDDIGDGRSLVYSGDFQMQRTYACAPIELRRASIAVVDSTFPHPDVTFEDHEAVKEELQRWVHGALSSGIVLFTAYKMGKAQELISIMNESGIRPVVSRRIASISDVYRRSGVMLDYATAYDGDGDREMRHCFVGIVETRGIGELAARMERVHGRRVHTAIASGLIKEFRFGAEGQFPLSSHADFSQTLSYLGKVRPELVLTYGRNRELMAANLREFGVNAEPFHDIENTALLNTPMLNR